MLEDIVSKKRPTLKDELKESIKSYPRTWVKYIKELGPSAIVFAAGSALGQWVAKEMGYDSNAAMTTAAYISGYVPAYSLFFSLEYFRNRDKYPSFFSRQMGNFATSFFAADYLADIGVFSPVFITSNILLSENTEVHPAIKGIAAAAPASFFYISAMAGLHPVVKRANEALNHVIRSAYQHLKRARNSKVSEEI